MNTPKYLPSDFVAFVGADIIRPVVSPPGKQRRRNAPTMQYEHFSIKILVYNVETWYILQHRYITGPIRFCPETCHVGGRIISAPTQSVPLNYCRGYFVAFVGAVLRTLPTGCDAVRLCRGRYYLPGCFPIGETTSAHRADNGTIKHLQMKFGGTMSKYGILATL